MTEQLRADIEFVFRQALAAVRADRAVSSHLHVDDHRQLVIDGVVRDVDASGVYAIAIGKASVTMIDAAAEAIGDLFTRGLAVTKSEPPSQDARITVLQGSHPVPDERSLAAGDAVLQFAAGVPNDAFVLMLISGGGSALVESLHDGVSLARLREFTAALLDAGASIHELNAVRSRLSRIKAGGLLRALAHARVYNLIVSDVLGDDLHTIASGPSVPPANSDAEQVMQRYQLSGSLPTLDTHTVQQMPPTTIVANLKTALDAAAKAATERGYRAVIHPDLLTGEASVVGEQMAAIVVERGSRSPRTCFLAGGETTVTVRGDGVGGRNTEAALAAAIRLSGVDNIALGCLATDGDDGITGAAGAIVDGRTVDSQHQQDAREALARNDSFSFLEKRDAIVVTGPTGTNVNDLVIGLTG